MREQNRLENETIVDILKRRALETPDKILYTFLDDKGKVVVNYSFEEVDLAARRIAATLQQECQLEKGDRVMLCYPPGLDFSLGFWGCLYAGAIGIPVYPPYPGTLAKDLPKFNRMVADSGAKVILTNRTYHLASKMATLKGYFSTAKDKQDGTTWPENVQWITTDSISNSAAQEYVEETLTIHDIAFFQYSSGSTSEPKAVMISHGNIRAQLKTWDTIKETDTMISWLPSYHDMGLVGFILVPSLTGARCVSMSPISFIKDPSMWIRITSEYNGTHICAPNFGYALAARKTKDEQVENFDLSQLKQAICAAEPIRSESLTAFTAKFQKCGFNPSAFNCGYGLAEVTLVATGQDPTVPKKPSIINVRKSALEQSKRVEIVNDAVMKKCPYDVMTLVGCGQAMPTFSVTIVNPDTLKELPSYSVGEVWIQGPSVAQGYWKREEYTKEMFHARIGNNDTMNYLRSGDMGFLHDNELYITGRLKDLIIIRGRNVCPQDVELSVENASPEVRPGCVAAFSIETNQQEEALVVVAELRENLKQSKKEELLQDISRQILKQVLNEHQLQCHDIVLVMPRSIPKTTSGKIQRRQSKINYENETLKVQYNCKSPTFAPANQQKSTKAKNKKTSQPPPATTDLTTDSIEPPTACTASTITVENLKSPEEIEQWLINRVASEHKSSTGEDSSEDSSEVLDPNTPWACFGLDSIAIVSLSAELGDFVGCVIPPSVFFQYDTPYKLARAPGLQTGEFETSSDDASNELGGQKSVQSLDDIDPSCYDIGQFAEVVHLKSQMETLQANGLRVPYLDTLTAEKRKQLNYNTYNYLGYASHPEVAKASKFAIDTYGTGMSSSPIVGQTIINEQLESALCSFFNAEASILFVGGWVTNVTTIDALVKKGDLILCDALNHNSCVVGQRLSGADIIPFPHNDFKQAERILSKIRHRYRRVLIVIEGVYSMDGDVPDLHEFIRIKKKYKCLLFLDEAHSFGTVGASGRGMVEYFNVDPKDVDVRMGTMSKSLGSVGGFILGSPELVQYLKYCAGGFVFSVGLGPANAGAALKSIELMHKQPERSVRLQELSTYFYDLCVKHKLDVGTNVRGVCVVVVYVGTTVDTVRVSMLLSDQEHINVKPIVYPAVEEGKCRLRFFISYLHTREGLKTTVLALRRVMDSVQSS